MGTAAIVVGRLNDRIGPRLVMFVSGALLGALFGLATFVGTVGGALGPVISGRLFDVAGDYQTAFSVLAVMMAVGFTSTVLIRPRAPTITT
jgi:MFS family permease